MKIRVFAVLAICVASVIDPEAEILSCPIHNEFYIVYKQLLGPEFHQKAINQLYLDDSS